VIEISDDIVMNSSSVLSHNATFHINVIRVTCRIFLLPHTGKESGTCYRKLSKHLEICYVLFVLKLGGNLLSSGMPDTALALL
jgi:hypothetical protein